MFRHTTTRLAAFLTTTVLCFVLTIASAQQTASHPASSPVLSPQAAQNFVTAQFGPAFTLLPGFLPLAGDLDGDGTEDLVLVATANNPLLDESQYHYRTIDPYNAFFGFGDPQVTMRFVAQEGRPRFVLIVHSWKDASPKAKFVVINLPFEKLEPARVRIKKKTFAAIGLEDRTGETSDLYWTGKQWKWVDANLKLE